jgi:hypothetical protein
MYRIKISTQTTDYVAYQNRNLSDNEFSDIVTGTAIPADATVSTWNLPAPGPYFYTAVWDQTQHDWCNNLAADQVAAARVAWSRESLP